MNRAPAIGIDLGTFKLCIAVFQKGSVEIIPTETNERTVPSYVSFNGENKFVGAEAKNQMRTNPTNTIYNIKRLIGYCYDEKSVIDDKKFLPFKIIKDPNSDRPKIQITENNENKEFYIEEIIALEFQKLKKIASDYLNVEVKEAIIGVPVYFNSLQRQIIREAAFISGFHVLRLINESTLAAIYYGMNRNNFENEENILIYDFGGGFLNISLCSLEEGLIEVKSCNGNTHLGGEDIDNRLMEYCLDQFSKTTTFDITNNPNALRRLKKECEKAKKILSSSKSTTIDIEEFINGQDLYIEINREKFEDICSDIFEKITPLLENTLKAAKMTKEQIDEIILIGGSSRIPKIQSILKEFFNGKELNQSLNPEEAVAMGAAIDAAIMTSVKGEKIEKLILMDVVIFSIGIETVGGVMNVLIPRNSNLPLRKTSIFTTYQDNQPIFKVIIYEGERQLVKDNHYLGEFILEGIPPMARGQPQIEITLDLDANYNLKVTAVEKSSGTSKSKIIIPEKGRLSKEIIEQLRLKFEEDEEKGTNRYKAKIKLENYCNKLNNNIQDIQLKINEILLWLQNNPKASEEEINLKREELNDLLKE